MEEIGVSVVAEIGVSVLEGEQLRELVGGVGQGTKVIISGEKCRRSEDRRVKRAEDRVK